MWPRSAERRRAPVAAHRRRPRAPPGRRADRALRSGPRAARGPRERRAPRPGPVRARRRARAPRAAPRRGPARAPPRRSAGGSPCSTSRSSCARSRWARRRWPRGPHERSGASAGTRSGTAPTRGRPRERRGGSPPPSRWRASPRRSGRSPRRSRGGRTRPGTARGCRHRGGDGRPSRGERRPSVRRGVFASGAGAPRRRHSRRSPAPQRFSRHPGGDRRTRGGVRHAGGVAEGLVHACASQRRGTGRRGVDTPSSQGLGGQWQGGWTDLGQRMWHRAGRGGGPSRGSIRRGPCGGRAPGSSWCRAACRGADDGPPGAPGGASGAEEPLWKRPVSSSGGDAASGGVRSSFRTCAVLVPGTSATVDCGARVPVSRPARLDPSSKNPSTGPRGHPVDNRELSSERVDLRRFPQSYAQGIHSCGEFSRVGGASCRDPQGAHRARALVTERFEDVRGFE